MGRVRSCSPRPPCPATAPAELSRQENASCNARLHRPLMPQPAAAHQPRLHADRADDRRRRSPACCPASPTRRFEGQLQKARRTDALVALMQVQAAQERWRSQQPELRQPGRDRRARHVGRPATTRCRSAAHSADGYEVLATATGAQARDAACRAPEADASTAPTSVHASGPDAAAANPADGEPPVLEPVMQTAPTCRTCRSAACRWSSCWSALAVGLFVAAAGAALIAGNLRENRQLLLEARLMQDLRTAADMIARDLRRAGYWAARDGRRARRRRQRGRSPTRMSRSRPATPRPTPCSFRFSRDATENNTVDSNEQFGFRLRNGAIEMQLGAGNWQALTDAGTLTVTAFSVTPTVEDDRPAAPSAPGPAPPAARTCPPRQQVRSLALVDQRPRRPATRGVTRSVRSRSGCATTPSSAPAQPDASHAQRRSIRPGPARRRRAGRHDAAAASRCCWWRLFANRNLRLRAAQRRPTSTARRRPSKPPKPGSNGRWRNSTRNRAHRCRLPAQRRPGGASSFRDRYLQHRARPPASSRRRTWNNGRHAAPLQAACVRAGTGWTCSCPAQGLPTLPRAGRTGAGRGVRAAVRGRRQARHGARRRQPAAPAWPAPALAGSTSRADASARVEVALGLLPAACARRRPPHRHGARRTSMPAAPPLGLHNPDAASSGIAVARRRQHRGRPGAPDATGRRAEGRRAGRQRRALAALDAGPPVRVATSASTRPAGRASRPSRASTAAADCSAALVAAIDAAADGALIRVDGDLALDRPADARLGASGRSRSSSSGTARFDGAVALHGVLYARRAAVERTPPAGAFVRGAVVSEGGYQGNGAPELVLRRARARRAAAPRRQLRPRQRQLARLLRSRRCIATPSHAAAANAAAR